VPARVQIRSAHAADVPALVALEHVSFSTDQLSKRQFQRHLGNPRASMRVAVEGERVLGYGLVFFRARSQVGRIYSLCVAAQARGTGLGARLLDALEQAAAARPVARMRLEVRRANHTAIALYQSRGYREICALAAYYQDGADGVRMEKQL